MYCEGVDMKALEREIRKYNILGWMQVRKAGSVHGEHPNRALWDICGKPSIQWVLEATKGCHYINKISVVTDSKEIKEVVDKVGGITIVDRPLWTAYNMPRDFTQGTFKRAKPRSILSAEAPIYNDTLGMSFYHLEEMEGYIPDIWINIGANEPMITTKMLYRLIEKFFEDEEAGKVITVSRHHVYLHITNPATGRLYPVMNLGGMDRQTWPPLYNMGAPVLTGMPSKCSTQPLTGKLAHIEVLPEEMIDMHDKRDLFLARCYMAKRLGKIHFEGGEISVNS